MKKNVLIVLVLVSVLIVFGLIIYDKPFVKQLQGVVKNSINTSKYIVKEGNLIKTRVRAPKGYKRVQYAENSFQEYLRNYPLKPYGSPIINYNDTEYFAQNWHEAILDVPVPKNGLQQCADALMRMRAEYLWKHNRKNEIGFNFTSGDYCSWNKYAKGYRPKIKGSKVTFHKKAKSDHSKINFYKYLNLIYTYAGTLSLYTDTI